MRNTTQYRIAGPRTFRLSSTKVLGKYGGNLQNIEKDLRCIYKSDGFTPALTEKCLYYMETKDLSVFTEEELFTLRIFVQTDQSGAEALIVAYLTEAGNYRELFKNKIKPHSFLGMHLFRDIWPEKMREHKLMSGDSDFSIDELCKLPIAALKQHKWWPVLDKLIKSSDNWSLKERYYYLAKQTEHSSNYDIKENTFRMNVLEKSGGKISISAEDAARFLDLKHGLFPEIKGYHRWVLRLAENNRIIYNLHGDPYQITVYEITESHEKEIYSWIPQSTVGQISNRAYTRMYTFIDVSGRTNTVHRVGKLDEEVTKALDIYGCKQRKWDNLANTHDSYLHQCPLSDELECAKISRLFIEQKFRSPIDGVEFQMGSETQSGFNWSVAKRDKDGKFTKNPLGLREIKGI